MGFTYKVHLLYSLIPRAVNCIYVFVFVLAYAQTYVPLSVTPLSYW